MNEQRIHELLQQSLQLYGSDLVSRVEWLLNQPGPEAAEARFRLRHGRQSDRYSKLAREFYADQKFDRDQQRGAPDGL